VTVIQVDVAAMIEPCSVAWHATNRSNLKPGQCVLPYFSLYLTYLTVFACADLRL